MSDERRSSKALCGEHHRAADSYPWRQVLVECQSGCASDFRALVRQGMDSFYRI